MPMTIVANASTNPYFNIALDAWLVRSAKPGQEYVMLWQNEPAVILGRFQNTYEEVDVDFAEAHQIAIVRRISGGGAVYQDLGNMNFSLIAETRLHPFNDYEAFTRPVLDTLLEFGVKAELTGRNDITIEGAKFSGNAQFRSGTHVLHHGTILFDEDLEVVPKVLTPPTDKIASKGIKSVRSRVTNVRPHLPPGTTMKDVQERLLHHIGRHNGGIAGTLVIGPDEAAAVDREVQARFGQWDWNFGASPPFNFRNRVRFPKGAVEVRLDASHGRIQSAKIYGDFLADRDIGPVEGALVDIPFSRRSMEEALAQLDVPTYLGGITGDELLEVLSGLEPRDGEGGDAAPKPPARPGS